MQIRRLQILPALLANYIHPRTKTPPLRDLVSYFFQPSREKRAQKYIENVIEDGGYRVVRFIGIDRAFYYPKAASWGDFCATIDECLNSRHWHQYVTPQTPVTQQDVIADCGAAEGLFTHLYAGAVKHVHLFEPVPKWVSSLKRNFDDRADVTVHPYGVGDKSSALRMTDNEIYSQLSSRGDIEVQVKSLDEALLDAPDPITFLKADVEGYEFQVLQGAEQLIKCHKPKVAITVYHKTNNVLQLKTLLEQFRPDYQFMTKGIGDNGGPVMLHAW